MATVAAGIVSSKIAAELLGPSGVGVMGIALSVVAVVQILAGAGLGQALVRVCGEDESAGIEPPHRDWVRASRKLLFGSSLLLLALSAALSPILSTPLFGAGTPLWWVPAIVGAGCLYAGYQLQLRTLVAHMRVRAVARTAVLIAFISPLVNLGFLSAFETDGIVPGALVSNVLVVLVASVFVEGELRLRSAELRAAVAGRYSRLLRDGLPLVPAQLLGSMTMLVLLVIVQERLSPDDAGFYRAAAAIALGYMVVVNTSISQDFFPRISRAVNDRAEFAARCDEQITIILSIATPLVVAVNIALPLLIPILYTSEFTPTIDVLQWQIGGDLLKLCGSIFATAVLAKRGSWARVGTEAIGAAALIACSLVGLELADLSGLGIGYLVAYLIYMVSVLAMLRGVGYRPSGTTVRAILESMLAALSVPLVATAFDSPWARLACIPVALWAGRDLLRMARERWTTRRSG